MLTRSARSAASWSASRLSRLARRPRRVKLGLEQMEERIALASLPINFSVPGLIAKQGVYVGITGKLIADYTPTYGPYAGKSLPNGSWVVLTKNPSDPLSKSDYALATPTTTLTAAFTPSSDGQTMNVASTFGFPTTGGSVNIFSNPAQYTALLGFTGVSSDTALGGVTFTNGSKSSYGIGSQVFLANQTVPLLTLFPDASSIPQNNNLVTAQIPIPDGAVAPLDSGQVVMSVGSPMKLNVTPTGLVAAPTTNSNPYDKFGLFEMSWKSPTDLDIDVSEVDQVGFPFYATAGNPKVTITGVSTSGNLATITTSGPHGLQAGDSVGIEGILGATNLNGTTFVSVPPSDATHFQVLLPPNTSAYTSGGTVTLLMPAPAQDGTGMILNRSDIFNGYSDYLKAIDSQYPSSNARAFLQAGANVPGSTIPLGTRISAPQDLIGSVEGTPAFVGGLGVVPIQPVQGGTLPINKTYYYAVTAVGKDGGESMQTPAQMSATPTGTMVLNWQPYPFAVGYNVYRATTQVSFNRMNILGPDAVKLNSSPIAVPTGVATLASALTLPASSLKITTSSDVSTFPKAGSLMVSAPGMTSQLLQYTSYDPATSTFTLNSQLGTGTVPVGARLTLLPNYTDDGSANGTTGTPPVNNYTYDPLNRYFTKALKDFFDYYTDNDFTIDMSSLKASFTGRVSTTVVPGYTVLNLTGVAGQYGNDYANKNVQVFLPFFSSNTDGKIDGVTNYPPAPAWLTSSIVESPSQMVFGADGVFNTVASSSSPPANDIGQKGVMNSIVSAFNRGLTPIKNAQGQWTNVLAPTYWANNPNPLIGSSISTTIPDGHQALSGTYYYAITAQNLNVGTTPSGETTLSNFVKVTMASGQNSTLLQWKPMNTSTSSAITSADPGQHQVTLADVSNFPAGGTFLAMIDGVSQVFEYQEIINRSGTQGTLNKVTSPTGGPLPTTGTAYGNIGASTAASFNIYRGTTPDNLVLIANVPNGTPSVSSFVDNGITVPATPKAPPFVFYGKGSTSNYYSAYLHQMNVSINGLAYGFPYDDQGGFSTNVQMRPPSSVGITLLPWTNATQIAASTPSGNKVAGQAFNITVVAKKADGTVDTSYTGTVEFASTDSGATLPGVYTFTKDDAGTHTFSVTLQKAGPAVITVRDSANSLNTSVSAIIASAKASQLRFIKAPKATSANLSQAVSVAATDSFGNVNTSVNGQLKVSGPFGTRLTTFKNGIANFNLAIARGGLFRLVVSSLFGSATSDNFAVTNTTSLQLSSINSVKVGTPFELTIQGRRPSGVLDTFYTGVVDVFAGRRKVGTVTHKAGVARIQVTIAQPGLVTLIARDQKRGTVIGLKTIRVTSV